MNTANYPVMKALIDYLTENCCQGVPAADSLENLEITDRELIQP